ncbi:MAG: cytochrome b/b6 domain-containing protein, partial [Chloroflexi bacterium]|nr:cytochrome b/b6 domain-containing protein [Chloroflexota bacterium]
EASITTVERPAPAQEASITTVERPAPAQEASITTVERPAPAQEASMTTVERYRVPTRVLHWTNAVAFLALIVTGLFLYAPALRPLAVGGVSQFIHRVSAVVFIAVPLIYMVTNWKAAWESVGEAFSWGERDIGWLKAAPTYYFLGDESSMPPQEHMNSGQKLYWLTVLVSGVVFTATGVFMLLGKDMLPQSVLQLSVFFHDVFFILILSMFVLHVYLSVLHPLMTGVRMSMFTGKVTPRYAHDHHAAWYERLQKKG